MSILSDPKNFATQKIGPLPMYGWIAIGVGGLLVYEHFKGSSTTGTLGTQLPNPAVEYINFSNGKNTTPNPPRKKTPKSIKHKRHEPPKRKAPIRHHPPKRNRRPRERNEIPRFVTVAKSAPHNHPWNSNLKGISQHYYGTSNDRHIDRIAHVNKLGTNENIHPGQRLKMPDIEPHHTERTHHGR
ncbi:MAG: hypothetical protein ACREHG_10235 [Candidatus Saccharimonadales bacterium]